MRDDLPSLTAALVSFGRGVGLPGGGRDTLAPELCPPPFAPMLRLYDAVPNEGLRAAYRTLSLGLVDHVSLRTSAIDRALGGALASGVRQLVILGAGLDARAHRIPALEGVPVFEVDHPSTQRYKRRRVSRRGETPNVVYVAVDFETDSLTERLEGEGFDASLPTAWVWEGVTMYLEPAAVENTLEAVARLSAPGSRLLATYILPDYAPGGPVAARFVRAFFETLGEGLRSKFERREIAEVLGRHGFSVLTDSSNLDWANENATSTLVPYVFRAERLVVAERGMGRV